MAEPLRAPAVETTGEFRGRVYDSILETIGATPLVRLTKLTEAHAVDAEILGKCEFFNPLSSVKDRIGTVSPTPVGAVCFTLRATPTDIHPSGKYGCIAIAAVYSINSTIFGVEYKAGSRSSIPAMVVSWVTSIFFVSLAPSGISGVWLIASPRGK